MLFVYLNSEIIGLRNEKNVRILLSENTSKNIRDNQGSIREYQ